MGLHGHNSVYVDIKGSIAEDRRGQKTHQKSEIYVPSVQLGEEIMISFGRFSRRKVLSGFAASSGLALTGLSASRAFAASKLVVGALYVGPKDDFGWNQAHAEGVAALKKMPGVSVIEEERVPETTEVEKSMESMVQLDNAELIFATSFGYWDHMLKVAAKFPKVQFLHAAPTVWKEGMPSNAGSYNGYIDEAQYVSGIVAGHMSKSGKLGFVAAKPYPASLRNINAFTLGARTVNPRATTQVIFTGDWVLPVKEAELVNSLADQGIEVVTCHVDSPKVVIETAEKRGLYSSGYHKSGSTGTQGISHWRGMELAKGLHGLCDVARRRQVMAAHAPRRAEGRHRPKFPLRSRSH